MKESEREKFIELYEIVKNLKTAKCRLAHERVQIDKVSKLPVSRQISETVYDRIGLCANEMRSKRLSCGHTSAHISVLDALEMLECHEGVDRDLWGDFDRILNQIYQLDHKKGFAEKDLAVLIETEINQPEEFLNADLEAAEIVIKEIEDQHDICIDKLENVRCRIVAEMQKAIEKF